MLRKTLLFAVAALAMVVFAPFVVFGSSAITNLSLDRSEVAPGQSINISVRTTPDTNYVFAITDGIRNQGVRVSTDAAGNHNWLVTINPQRSTNTVLFANTINIEGGAASITMPVSVTGAQPTGPAFPHPMHTPAGPLEIVSVQETPAITQGEVRLTIVTGLEVGSTWVMFEGQRFSQGEMVSQDATTRTWVVSFRPTRLVPQTVQIGANRTFIWPGASLQDFQVTMAQLHHLPTVTDVIQNIVVAPRDVAPGGMVTITVSTAPHVGAVWMRDTAGWEHNARAIAPTTATTRTWQITFNPMHSGSVTIFANQTRQALGAAQRVEHITVGGGGLWHIMDANAVPFGAGAAANTARLTVQTTAAIQTVWVVTGNQQIVPLAPTTHAVTGMRTWTSGQTPLVFPLTIRASHLVGANVNNLRVDAEAFLPAFGNIGGGQQGQHPNWPWMTPQILSTTATTVGATQVNIQIVTNEFVETMWLQDALGMTTQLGLIGSRTGPTRTFGATRSVAHMPFSIFGSASPVNVPIASRSRHVQATISQWDLVPGGTAQTPRNLIAIATEGSAANTARLTAVVALDVLTVWAVGNNGTTYHFTPSHVDGDTVVFVSDMSNIPAAAFPLTVRGSTSVGSGSNVVNLPVRTGDTATVARPTWLP